MSTVRCKHCNQLTPFPTVDVKEMIRDMIRHCKDEHLDKLLIKYGYNPEELLKSGKRAVAKALKEYKDNKNMPVG